VKKLCFSTYVYGWYQDFIPIYIYSILYHWPHHFVKIFLHEQLTDYNKEALEIIRKEVGSNFEIIENYQDRDVTEIPCLAALRFVMLEEDFEEFDYVYFGDVDFIIYNCFNDNFYDTYVEHCGKTKLPFSNEWNYDYEKYRATGLHFIIKEPYYDVLRDDIITMRKPNGNYFRNQTPNCYMYDEQLLYYLLCFKFDLRPLIGHLRPLHGLHFGTFRRIDEGHSFVPTKLHSDEKEYLPQWIKDKPKINPILNSELMKFSLQHSDDRFVETVKKTKNILSAKMFF